MLNLGSKTSPSSQVFGIPSNFRNQCRGTETGAFPWPSCIVLVKKWSNYKISSIILSINQWSLYHLKKYRMNNHIYISQLSTSLCFYKVLFEVKKTDVRLNKTLKLKFILMLFDSVDLTRSSDTVTKYIIYPPILLVKGLFEWSWVLFCYFIVWLAKPDSKMPCILLFEIEYSV